MPRIEELPDDFDEALDSLNLDGHPSSTIPSTPPSQQHQEPPDLPSIPASAFLQSVPFPLPADGGPAQPPDAPALPPQMASVQAHTADEILALMNRTPLFMTSLDETDGAGGENAELEALKALAYDGSPREVAENFREQGNECFRAKQWKDAVEFYTKAVVVLRDAREKRAKGESVDVTEGSTEVEDAREERRLEELCFGNRAACNLELKNYRRTISDCASALTLNPRNTKALYRSARACYALDKLDEADDALTRALHLEPTNTALTRLSGDIATRRALLETQERKRREREAHEKAAAAALKAALHMRGIRTRTTDKPPEMEDAAMELKPDPLDPRTSTLSFPLLLLYPLEPQTDFIFALAETETLGDHLEYILPPPWDAGGRGSEYAAPERVLCYMETVAGGLLKVGRKMAVGKVLATGKVEVVDGLLRVFVVPSGRADEWIAEMKRKSGKAG